MPFRTDKPFGKIIARFEGTDDKIEFLGDGQQFVAHGIHPDTKAPYQWFGGEPGKVKLNELPLIDEKGARLLVNELKELLAKFGYEEPKKEKSAKSKRERERERERDAGDITEYQQLNDEAIANSDAWVPKLFPGAEKRSSDKGWRVPSAALGRKLEEDLSFSPAGIKDFGVYDMGDPRKGKRTPIDIVMEWHLRVPIEDIMLGYHSEEFDKAVDWLREALGHPDEAESGRADIVRMNKTHAVLPIGGKTRVVTFGEMEEFPGRTTIVMTQSFSDFAALYDKFSHKFKSKEKDTLIKIPLGTYWLDSPKRRQYTGGMAFLPQRDEKVVNDRLNLWQGYGVDAVKPAGKSGAAGASKFLDFARDVICSGDEAHFDYLIKREAFILQRRARSEIALGLSTIQEGVGKGVYEQIMRRLLGNHAMQVGRPEHVIGKFNPHLETLLRLTADEALFVGDLRHRNALYGLITEKENTIEPKFCGAYSAPNYLNISITTNAPHFAVVGEDARRFFVPTVSPIHKQDFEYFRAIFDQLNDGGYQALLYHLLNEVDLRDFEVRKVPRTAGLLEQISYSRRGVDGLVEEVCSTARVPDEHPNWLHGDERLRRRTRV